MARSPIKQSPGLGKKIDVFTYDLTTPVGTDKTTIDLLVYMNKSFSGDTPPYEVTGAEFRIVCEAPSFQIVGTDLQFLLGAARARLDKAYAIKWESWFKVQIIPERVWTGEGTGFRLSYDTVWRGVDAFGHILMREFDRNSDTNWKISAWPDAFKDASGRTLACVPASEATEAALKDFSNRIIALRKRLADFVSPDHIHNTLEAISSGTMPLLPSPDD